MLFCDARRAARHAPDGGYVPLSEPDPAAWSVDAIRAERAQSGRTDWAAIVVFYWAVRAHLLRNLGRSDAAEAYDRAIGLAVEPATRRFLLARRG
jgi:predicted RNA polymerase sigma factor